MKKAIICFTKVPKVGVCKTRLTEARGGILTPEEANAFYEACILDVIDVCLSVEEEDIWLCYNQDGDRSYLDSILTQLKYPKRIVGVFPDQGGSFDDCMQYATDFILKSGSDERLADAVLISGGDLPTLQPYILREALNKLEKLSLSEAGQKGAIREVRGSDGTLIGASLVEAACQEGGFSLVGLTCTTNFNFNEVFYNLNGITALDMLVTKAARDEIPFGYVEMVPDVDIPVDLASQLPVLQGIVLAAKNDPALIVPQRTISLLDDLGLQSHALPPVREIV